jgi:DNA-binding transcriptional ArsR family regulator
MSALPHASLPVLRRLRFHYQALASITRLRILNELARSGEQTVQEIADALGISQPRLSWHLRMLRRGELVSARRAGRALYCSLNREALTAFQRRLASLIESRPQEPIHLPETPVRAPYQRSEA